jgi:single-strand DNA-binding protein
MSNTCAFAGRLGGDAELRFTTNQRAVLKFNLATDMGWGERKRTMWVRCSLWGKRAESAAPHLLKGTPVTVFGQVEHREYEKANGEKGSSLDLDVRDFVLQGGKRQDAAPAQPDTGGFRDAPSNTNEIDPNDDIPF